MYTRHIVNEMDGMQQHCLICGELVTDHTNIMYPLSQGPPKGFPQGYVWIDRTLNPTVLTTIEPDDYAVCNLTQKNHES